MSAEFISIMTLAVAVLVFFVVLLIAEWKGWW